MVGTAAVGDPTGPDTYGYYIFDNADPDPNAPTYNWLDIAAIGQNTGIVDNGTYGDDTRTLDLPFAFTMYGAELHRVSICSNGWLAMGHTYQRLYRNWHLPSDGGPGNMICAFWDDLAGGTRLHLPRRRPAPVHRAVGGLRHRHRRRLLGQLRRSRSSSTIPPTTPPRRATARSRSSTRACTIYGDETTYFTTGLQNGDRTTGVTYAYGNHYAGGAAASRRAARCASCPSCRRCRASCAAR